MRPRRSCLSVPARPEKMLAKGPGIAADEVVVDLEDSVPAELKGEARAASAEAIAAGGWAAGAVSIRINALDSEWCADDVAALAGKVDTVVLPKAERAADVRSLVELLAAAERRAGTTRKTGIQALIESALGLRNAAEIAEASPRLEALILGPADMSVSLGFPSPAEGPHWTPVRLAVLVAARAAGLQAIDGPFLRVEDVAGMRASATIARDLGFDGKWALRPAEVESLNETFSPDPAELAQATGILAALAREPGRGAVMLDGEMIDEASRKRAERTLARAGAG